MKSALSWTITYFPNTCILTCPLLLSFLLAYCFFFPVTLFILLPKWTYLFFFFFSHLSTVTFFPFTFFPTWNCYFLSCFFFSHLSTVTFFPVTFFSCYIFSYLKLLLSFLLPFFLLLSFRAPPTILRAVRAGWRGLSVPACLTSVLLPSIHWNTMTKAVVLTLLQMPPQRLVTTPWRVHLGNAFWAIQHGWILWVDWSGLFIIKIIYFW